MILSEKVGALKTTDFIKKLVTVTTEEQFCKSIGHSREKIDQDILNLSTFGESFLETSQRMGVGYRELRKLPDEEREIIINGEAERLTH